METRIMHFEDDSKLSLNTAFRKLISIKVQKSIVDYSSNFDVFQKMVASNAYRVFVLDIMTADTRVVNGRTGLPVSRHRVGIEILEQIRNGELKKQDSNALIIMRSARCVEDDINDLCISKGANYFFGAGSEDIEIAGIIAEYLK